MADSFEGEGSNGGMQGRRPSVTMMFWVVLTRPWVAFGPDPVAQVRRATYDEAGREAYDQARQAAYDQARAAYDQARAAYAHARAYDHALTYAHLQTYVSLAVKASGLLALLLSTVILLGGYVQSLEKKDFFCIMAITVIQAAGSVINLLHLFLFCPFSL